MTTATRPPAFFDPRPARSGLRARLAFLREPCLYLHLHRWFLTLAAIDVLLTSVVLSLGGQEANIVPQAVLARAGLGGMVALKTASVILVLLVCELVGRKREPVGRGLALGAIAANSAAAALGGAYLTIYSPAAYF